MKRVLGISVYPDHSELDQDKAYIELAHKYGFGRVWIWQNFYEYVGGHRWQGSC